MKVLWLCPYPIDLLQPELNLGREKVVHSASWVVNLSNELIKNDDIELHIITKSQLIPFSQSVNKNNINFYVIRSALPLTYKGYPKYFPFEIFTSYLFFRRNALKLFKKINPDIIHAYGTESAYSIVATYARYPVIISMQGIVSEILKDDKTILGKVKKKHEKVVINKSKNFDCRTNFDKQFVKSINSNASIFHIPRAINPVYFQKNWGPAKHKYILFVGSIIPNKGLGVLIDSVSLLIKAIPDIKLKIIGSAEGEYFQALINKITQFNLIDNIIFTGFYSPPLIAEELEKATLFILPTLMDNSPNALAEAMAVGTPSIASNVGGVPSMIEDGYNGFLVEPGNSQNLAEKIISLIDDETTLIKISKNARKTAINRNYPEKVAQQTIKVYKQILESN